MSTATIATVSEKLKKRLNEALGGNRVELNDPAKASDNSVSLWLYQVVVDEFARNRTPTRAEAANGRAVNMQLPPLPLNLFYLITPMTTEQDAAQTELAKVMLALHEEPELLVEGVGVNDTVRVTFQNDTLDDRVKLWESLSHPYRLSVCYQVRTAKLESRRVATEAPAVSTKMERQPGPNAVTE
jgi:hypothetical protein